MQSSAVTRSEGRGRKRRRNSVQHTKKQVVETRLKALVGRYVKKEFEDSGIFLGKIVYYDSGLYRVDYEDGDCEDLECGEVKEFLIGDADLDSDWIERKKKLDDLVSKRSVKANEILLGNVVDSENAVDRVEASLLSETSYSGANEIDAVQINDDADSSSDSCEYSQNQNTGFKVEVQLVPPPKLPPSSRNIGVPEECVLHLLSVYSFLRSFSIRLFLSPFGLDDFVGSLKCPVPNTLLDAIHVVLMRALRRHLETLYSDGSELASKCLRGTDWSLLDTMTWPVYLVQYLTLMGYTKGPEWKRFYIDISERGYYNLSVDRKLVILQILCDDVLESAELRAEIDMREEAEVGVDSDEITVVPESGPTRVHPRHSKTSACKDQEAMDIIAESHETKFPCSLTSSGCKHSEPCASDDLDQDGNSDECRLCGMDGTLLCCDGCPSAYHSRCIGVTKMIIPEGAWYCHECTINKIGPTFSTGTSLKGAEIFGVDLYELQSSINSEPCLRYYNQNDIPSVLWALHSSMEHIALYSGICKGISQYWKIPEDYLSLPGTFEMGIGLVSKKENDEYSTPSPALSGKEGHKVLDVLESENFGSCLTENRAGNVAVSCLANCCKEPAVNNTSLDATNQSVHPVQQKNSDSTIKQVCPLTNTKSSKQIKVESSMSEGSVSQHAGPSDLMPQSLTDRSSVMGITPCTIGNSNLSNRGHVNGMHVAANMSLQIKEGNDRVSGRCDSNSVDGYFYMGSVFKPQGYTNHYAHGDFAASAAANLATILSGKHKFSEPHASDNPRKVMSVNVSLQVKAFSSAATRFFWPNSEKKLVEVPRERCGWCLSCKAPATSKRGCLLNAAASNAIKGAVKTLNSLHLVKNREGSLPSIATYIMFMEESLHGLTVGPFLNATYRRQWRKQVEQATTCNALKTLLLELEGNIRVIALSGDWVRLVDNWSVESSVTRGAACAVGSTQKRGVLGKRGRKRSSVSEVTTDDCPNNSRDFIWWRGGILSKLIYQKGILPCSMVKKAARQGGFRKISGIYYAEGSEVPKRSRQYVWRAAVEMSKNVSQLALQVRYLDLHVRWSDLVRSEQNLPDGKGPETEAPAFTDAFICDKKIVENKIRYGVSFGNQKHLPSRIMKAIIETEQSQDGSDKYWFSETCIPLYLIKEYEENIDTMFLPLADKRMNGLSKLQRQLKASRKDIFSYLSRKRDNLGKCSCASCQLDVLLGNAIKCSSCQGYCHELCTISSTIHLNEEVEFIITCKQCHHTRAFTENENCNESPTSPLLLKGQEFQNAATVTKGSRQKGPHQRLTAAGNLESSSKMKPATHNSTVATKNRRTWGLIWKKKKEDSGTEFILKNILLKGNPDTSWSGPECHLCHKPYNSDLMYIHCDTCKNWYHADAVELEESKIFQLMGFKCCKCRRIKSPICPYLDPESKKLLAKKPQTKTPMQGLPGKGPDTGTIYEQLKGWEPTTPVSPTKEELVHVQEDDPLLFALSRVEQLTENNSEMDPEWSTTVSGPGPQKLPVRRHMKRENGVDGFSANKTFHVELSTPLEANSLLNPKEQSLTPHVEWDVYTSSFEDDVMFNYNYEDMEFEPQTYFSITELLASDNGDQLDGVDASGGVTRNWENLSALSGDRNTEHYALSTSTEQQEPTIKVEPSGGNVPCWKCSHTEASPGFSCQICGL